MGMTSGMQRQNELERIKLAQLHGDLDAIGIIQGRLLECPLKVHRTAKHLKRIAVLEGMGFTMAQTITFEGKKHLWNMVSRLTKRVDDVILKDGMLVREVIHLAAKGRKA